MSLCITGLVAGDILESEEVREEQGPDNEWVRITIICITEHRVSYKSSKGLIATSSINNGISCIRDSFKLVSRVKKSIKISELV